MTCRSTVDSLRQLAAERGLTLAAFLRAELDRLATRPSNAEIVDRLARRDRSGGPLSAESVAEIRRVREVRGSVIESSAMVDALVGNRFGTELSRLLATEELHSLSLLDFEVASALRGHVLAGKLSEPRLNEALADFGALHVERYRDDRPTRVRGRPAQQLHGLRRRVRRTRPGSARADSDRDTKMLEHLVSESTSK